MLETENKADVVPIVYVVDDDPAMRAALDTLLRSVGFHVVAFASTAEFRAAGWENIESCLLLDVRLRGESGLVFQQQTEGRPLIPIVFMSGFADVQVCRTAMKGGAVDFLVKPFADQELIDAVNLALSFDAKRRTQKNANNQLQQSFALLTRREREVLSYVISGALNKQTASYLGLSVITIKLHRASVMRKMKAASLADLVRKSAAIGVQMPVHDSRHIDISSKA
ncbi:response regulator [Paraburkholderia strydomiana]|jgi:FixJ family two-component response regulator|uniref:response regulator transcription factor n=1 Tax=Paraburkholderia TaxID=1822464 RepID=UPI0038BDAEAC